MASTSKTFKCACTYKCAFTLEGYQMLSRSIFFQHRKQEALHKVHPDVHYNRNLEALQGQSPNVNELDSTPPLQSASDNDTTRRMWCTCSAFFQGGKYVGKTTFLRHAQLRSVAGNLASELGFVNRDGVEVRHFDDNIPHMESSDASLNVEEGFEEGIEVRSASTTGEDEDCQQPRCPDHALLGIAILSKIIQFQTLWDEYQ
ncbi:hypothetical protein GOP47_0030993, partial [Adiantum capillus-veneris]